MTEEKLPYFISKFGTIHWNEFFALPLGRIAFLSLEKPNTTFDKPKFGLNLLIDKNTEEKALLKPILDVAKKLPKLLWGDKAEEMYKKITNVPFRNGDDKEYEGFEGHYVVVANNPKGPKQAGGIKILNQGMEPEQFEAGMTCRLSVSLGLGKEGYFYKLNAIKLVKDDGVRFAGGPDGSSVIEDLDTAVEVASVNQTSFELGDI